VTLANENPTPALADPAPALGASASALRHDWTLGEIEALLARPLLDLVFDAQRALRAHFDPRSVQRSTLLSIKTGACPEDCGYCPQSAHHDTGLEKERLLPLDEVLASARRAREAGASRFCMGAAWRSPREGKEFDQVLEMVRGVAGLGMEVCATLGMLEPDQAHRLAEAGLTAYNHNLDTSEAFYPRIISTRTYQDRLDTIANVQAAGMHVCCGGIVGMGESRRDRAALLRTLACMDPHPESVPINVLVKVQGTPLAVVEDFDALELVRMIATARILMPASRVRLSAGRTNLSREAQTLCYLAGANSIFFGEKLLTTPNPEVDEDLGLLAELGLVAR
jgi:biotin synthase